MSLRRRFRPSESWTLEDRLAPSSVGASEIHALATETLGTVRGNYSTTSKSGVDTISSVATLVGSTSVSGIGAISLGGSLSNTVVVPNHNGPTSGLVTLIAANRSGSLTLAFTGPYANLAPTHSTTVTLAFKVVKATGSYAAGLGVTGTAVLTLQETVPAKSNGHQATTTGGKFTLVISV